MHIYHIQQSLAGFFFCICHLFQIIIHEPAVVALNSIVIRIGVNIVVFIACTVAAIDTRQHAPECRAENFCIWVDVLDNARQFNRLGDQFLAADFVAVKQRMGIIPKNRFVV